MSFGPAQLAIAHWHIDFFPSGKKNPLGTFPQDHHIQWTIIGITPKKHPLPTFSFAAVTVNFVNPLSGHMFPVKPLPGISGGGGGGGGATLGYGS